MRLIGYVQAGVFLAASAAFLAAPGLGRAGPPGNAGDRLNGRFPVEHDDEPNTNQATVEAFFKTLGFNGAVTGMDPGSGLDVEIGYDTAFTSNAKVTDARLTLAQAAGYCVVQVLVNSGIDYFGVVNGNSAAGPGAVRKCTCRASGRGANTGLTRVNVDVNCRNALDEIDPPLDATNRAVVEGAFAGRSDVSIGNNGSIRIRLRDRTLSPPL